MRSLIRVSGLPACWAGRLAIHTRAASADLSAELTGKTVDLLKARRAANGSWSADRNEPGITALVVIALLRSGRVTPAEPPVSKALFENTTGGS